MSERSIFLSALEIKDPTRRSAFLDEACGTDATLRQQVEGLLRSHAAAGSFLEPPTTGVIPGETLSEEGAGSWIGPYRLLHPLGEGGMGTVWLAEQTKPVQRQVALKVIKPGMDSRSVIARFDAERQAIALMDHPNIARVFEVGSTESGRPYIVMELVQGVPITRYCDEQRLTPEQRLELFVPVCQAVQHAHQKGIIHRDLKPSNVLVTLYDGKPVPKVIDFGIAKATGQQLREQTQHTEFGAIIGTLEYMSPEQAEANPLDIDTRSDVYSLGVLLYELLTGTIPLERKKLKEAALLEVLRRIREEEPPRPSTRLSTSEGLPSIAANRGLDPKKLNGLVRGELDWIVMKSLEKDRNRRYETANSFAADVQRYLHDEPVQACPPSAAYRLRKFVRRNKGPVLAVAVVLLALVGGIIGTSWGLLRATQAEGEAVAESHAKGKALTQVRQEQRRTQEEQQRTKAALLQARRETAHMAFEQAYGKCTYEGPEPGVLALAYSLQKARAADLPELEQAIRAQLAGWVRPLHPQRSVFFHHGKVSSLAFSPDGKTVVTVGPFAQLWEVGTDRASNLPLQGQATFVSVAFSPDGKTVLLGGMGGIDRPTRLWEVKTGKPLGPPLQYQGLVRAVAFSPDGKIVLTGSDDKTAHLWEVETGKPLGLPLQHRSYVTAVAFGPDGKTVLTGSDDKTARLWEVETGKPLGPPLEDHGLVRAVAFSPDGKTVATGNGNSSARLWKVETGEPLGPAIQHRGAVTSVAFSPDGKTVVTGCSDKTARFWEVETGKPLGLPLLHRSPVHAVAFSPDGKTVLTGSDLCLCLWEVGRHNSLALSLGPDRIAAAAISPDAKMVLTGTHDNTAQLWDAWTGKPIGPPLQHQSNVSSVAFSPNGKTVVTGSWDKTAQLWEVETGKPLGLPLRHPDQVRAVAFSPDGKSVLTGGGQARDKTARLWGVETGKPLGRPMQHQASVQSVAFSPDGKIIVTGSWDMTARLWEAETGKPFGLPMQHHFGVNAVVFSPDGKTVVTGSMDKTAQLWEARTGKPMGAPIQHQSEVTSVAFSPDGKMILTGSREATAQLWEAGTGKAVGPPLPHPNKVCAVAFSSDGKTVLTGNVNGPTTLWHVAPVQGDVTRITLWVQVLTGMELDDKGVPQGLDFEARKQRRARLERLGGAPWP